MRHLWNWIDSKNWTERSKYAMIILIFAAIAGIAGFGVWSIIRLWALDHWSWMIVFTGYPVFFAIVLIIAYSFNHEFHDGAHKKDGELSVF